MVLADICKAVNINLKENIMPNYDTYNTDPYARFLDWRNGQQNQSLNPLKGRQLGITPDITRQGNWQTGSNILTPQNAGGQGMSQVGEGKYVSNSLAKYYNNGTKGTQQVSPLNAGANNNLPMTQNSEMMGPQRPGFAQNLWNKAKNSYRDSPFNKAIHPDSPWAGGPAPVASGTNAVGGMASTVQGGGMGGAMGYLGAANAIMGMMNRNQGSSQPVVSQPVVVNNPPPMGGSYSRGERRNRLSSLPNYASGFGNVPNKNALLYKPRYAGYETRDITPSEDTFFQKNPHVAGMATEDKRIITNPHSGLPPQQNELVRMLEASRLYMNDNNINPDFELTPNQVDFFNDPSMKVVGGVQYRDNPNAAKQSIISRIIVGDPSAQDVTPEQQSYADMISEKMGIKPRMGTKPQYAANFIGSPDVDEFGNPIRSGNALVRIMNRETPNNQSVFNTPTQASPTSMESPTTASIEKPGLFTRIGNAFRPKEQPIPADYNTPEGANYLNKLMTESQRKPTFTEKLPQALALMSGAFDPYGRFANANANIINMAQQQEQARRQAPVNYLNQVMARKQVENLPFQQKLSQAQLAHLEAQTKALRVRPKLAGTKEVVKQMPDGTYHSMLVHENTGRVIQDLGIATPKQTGYDKATRLDTYTAEVDGKPMEVERTLENIAKYPAYMEEKKDKFEKQVEDYEKYFTRGMDKLSPEELGNVRKSEDYQKALASYIKPDITGVQSYEYKPKAEKKSKWYERLSKPKDSTNQTQGIIDKALQEDRANATQNIVLPKEIKTRSQAIEFLKSDQGMTAEQALQWIEAND